MLILSSPRILWVGVGGWAGGWFAPVAHLSHTLSWRETESAALVDPRDDRCGMDIVGLFRVIISRILGSCRLAAPIPLQTATAEVPRNLRGRLGTEYMVVGLVISLIRPSR